jgi:O-methyltransferase
MCTSHEQLAVIIKHNMRQFLVKISNLLNPSISRVIRGLLVYIRSRHLYSSWKIYTMSDETNKYQHITEAINYLRVAGANNRLPQSYFEFGCHSGRTFSAAMNAANYLKMEDFQFHAFDSFGGLPPTSDDDGYFEEGTFNTSEKDFLKIVKKRTGKKLSSSSIHKGYYSESLTKELQESLPKAGVVYVDVDLYSSTVELFQFMKPLLVDGSVILFDDWYCFPFGDEGGEGLAMKEFLQKNPNFELIPWKTYSTFGQSFFIKIK